MLNRITILLLCLCLSACGGYKQKKPEHMLESASYVGLGLLGIPASYIGGGFLFNSIISNSKDIEENDDAKSD